MRHSSELIDNLHSSCTVNTNEDNKRLLPLVSIGDKSAREEMIKNNTSLVLSLVASYLRKNPGDDYLQDDLVGEGMLGLVEAVNHCAANHVTYPTAFIGTCIYHRIAHLWKSEKNHRACIHWDFHVCSPSTDKDNDKRREDDYQIKVFLEQTGLDRVTAPTSGGTADLDELLLTCCSDPTDKQILTMRAQGHTLAAIATTVKRSSSAVHKRLKKIHKKFEEKNFLFINQG